MKKFSFIATLILTLLFTFTVLGNETVSIRKSNYLNLNNIKEDVVGHTWVIRFQHDIKNFYDCHKVVATVRELMIEPDLVKKIGLYDFSILCMPYEQGSSLFTQFVGEPLTKELIKDFEDYIESHQGQELYPGLKLKYSRVKKIDTKKIVGGRHWLNNHQYDWDKTYDPTEYSFLSYFQYRQNLDQDRFAFRDPDFKVFLNQVFKILPGGDDIRKHFLNVTLKKANYIYTWNSTLYFPQDGLPLEGLWQDGTFRYLK